MIRQLSGHLVDGLTCQQLEDLARKHGDELRSLKRHVVELQGGSIYKFKIVTSQGRLLDDEDPVLMFLAL